jgi:hypothetical protein
MRAKLLYTVSGTALVMMVLHCLFWIMFDWAEELPKLSAINAGIMEVLNLVCIFTMLFQTVASFILARKAGLFTPAEKSIVLFIGGFYLVRAAFGFPIFGISITETTVILVCLALFALNLLALRQPLERA